MITRKKIFYIQDDLSSNQCMRKKKIEIFMFKKNRSKIDTLKRPYI